MNNYIISVTGHCPCPRMREYRVQASGYHTAVSRAIRQYRQELGKKKIEQINIKAKQL